MNRIAKAFWTAKGVGWDNLPRRLLQRWRIGSGALRRRLDASRFSDEAFRADCAATLDRQEDLWRHRRAKFLAIPTPADLGGVCDETTWSQQVLTVAENALAGQYQFFSRWFARSGWPPDFNLDPVAGVRWPTGRHWLEAGDSLQGSDIKIVWEPSRFTLPYCLARAYARGGDEKWARAFWEMFDAWVEQCPPELSVAWGCGQEMTFRLMAMLTAAMATLDSPAATPDRLFALTRLAWQTGRHISININQARMQGNNHALSEAVGLWTAGLLFEELKEAAGWRRRGENILAAEIVRQIYDDGSFVQHSLNYHRVMMDDLLWACALARRNDLPAPSAVTDALDRANRFLVEMVDPTTGRVPNYGANDGSEVLPLSCCDYLDYRPTAQAASCLLHGRRCFPPGPWDEQMLWLAGPEALACPVEQPARRPAFAAESGGYYVLRGPGSQLMTRCHSYRDRPGQADMLHVDLWYGGVNVLRDAGSYSYHCQRPWQHYFLSTGAHNTVEIDGQDQMVKGPRFLWFRWTRSRREQFETSGDGATGVFQGRLLGYGDLGGKVQHRRSIVRNGDSYTIIDDVLLADGRTHLIVLRWRLCPADWRDCGDGAWAASIAGADLSVAVGGPHGLARQLTGGEEGPRPEGWESLYYGEKTPVPTIIATIQAARNIRLVTLVAPGVPDPAQRAELARLCREVNP